MTTTENLQITHIEQAQEQKEVIANAGFDRLDKATQGTIDINVAAGGTIQVSSTDYLDNYLLRLTGSPGADFTLEVPDGGRHFAVENLSGKIATIETESTGGETVILGDQRVASLFSKGTDIIELNNLNYLHSSVDIDTSAGGVIVVSIPLYLENFLLRLTGSPGGAYDLEVPDIKRQFAIENISGQTATIRATTTGSGEVTVTDGSNTHLFNKSTDVIQL